MTEQGQGSPGTTGPGAQRPRFFCRWTSQEEPLPPAPLPEAERGGGRQHLPQPPSPKRRGGSKRKATPPPSPPPRSGEGEQEEGNPSPAPLPEAERGEEAGECGGVSGCLRSSSPLRFGEGVGGRGSSGAGGRGLSSSPSPLRGGGRGEGSFSPFSAALRPAPHRRPLFRRVQHLAGIAAIVATNNAVLCHEVDQP